MLVYSIWYMYSTCIWVWRVQWTVIHNCTMHACDNWQTTQYDLYNVLVRTQIVETVHVLSWNLRPIGYNCWIMCNTCCQTLTLLSTPWFTLNQHLGWQSTKSMHMSRSTLSRLLRDCLFTKFWSGCRSSTNQDVNLRVSIDSQLTMPVVNMIPTANALYM